MKIYDSDTIDKILHDFSEAAAGLRILARVNRLHHRPYRNLLNLSEKLIKIVEVINYERNN